ncbi:hypothetical protein BDY19DRAFT_935808 [Irpex rosettiformis]|uniref:Uncharacterized protein n=1 Tax=Irpex rosettiformis TaxID=378272 RepID=A0ACB8U8F4_9APHY|nr:hypothetical protein BDY19DRAFT_935808 [Irpex rosettiformis]
MSLKAELETWAAALKAYDEEDFENSIRLFSEIADSSKILTNIGLIYATLGEHEAAVEQFLAATQLDQFLAVAYFQCGVSNFLLQRYDLAKRDFEDALLYLRGNQNINYEQLGLKFKLYSAEVLFNKALSQLYLGDIGGGLQEMEEARKEKATDEHNVIDDAIADQGEGYTVFSIPVGILYRPSENKLKNAKTKDYMGKAKLVATSDASEAYTTFTGVTRLRQGITPSGVLTDDAPPTSGGLSRAVTVSVTSRPAVPDVDRPLPALQRAKTTITVPADARERIRAAGSGGSSPSMSDGVAGSVVGAAIGAGLARSVTSAGSTNRMPAGPGSIRSLSVRRPGGPAPINAAAAAAAGGAGAGSARISPQGGSGSGRNDARLTDFYDDYPDSYGGEDAPPVPPMPMQQSQRSPGDRVANWAKNNANPLPPQGMMRSRSVAPSSYAPSSVGGTMRRKMSRRAPTRSTYYEEEEGYVSGDYDDAPFEMTKIRVKIHYQDDVRGMALDASLNFEEFIDRITAKFGKSFTDLGMKFKDEDGGKVTLRDESDYELAIETAKESAKGKPEGKLEVWCTDAK